ncbi:MAG: LysR family transcriptional regulator [Kiloniellales bacterium]|nr:LysR family transcriptional regulator [Kiloniellales bacterium]
MEISALQVFAEVMRRGSFAAVARDRDVSPSAISRSVAALEAELGLRLFQRTTRRLAPTEAGALYFARVEPLLGELEQARQAATDLQEAPSGTLRVTASVAFGQTCLVPLLPELQRRYPQLALELLLTDSNLDLVAERIDVALRLGPRRDSGLIGLRLFDTRYRVCVSPDYLARNGGIATPEMLRGRPCLTFALPGFRSRWIFLDPAGRRTEVPIEGRFVISSALAQRDCALNGLGPALLADWLIGADIAAGRLVDLFPGHRVTATDFDTAAWLLYPSRAYLPLKVRAFVDFLKVRLRPGGLSAPEARSSGRRSRY